MNIKDSHGNKISPKTEGENRITFPTIKGESYKIDSKH